MWSLPEIEMSFVSHSACWLKLKSYFLAKSKNQSYHVGSKLTFYSPMWQYFFYVDSDPVLKLIYSVKANVKSKWEIFSNFVVVLENFNFKAKISSAIIIRILWHFYCDNWKLATLENQKITVCGKTSVNGHPHSSSMLSICRWFDSALLYVAFWHLFYFLATFFSLLSKCKEPLVPSLRHPETPWGYCCQTHPTLRLQ